MPVLAVLVLFGGLAGPALAGGPKPTNNAALCFPTEQWKVVPGELDPNEVGRDSPLQVPDVTRYLFENGPANLAGTDERLFVHGIPKAREEEVLPRNNWVYNTALVVGHDGQQQLEHLLAGLMQPLPEILLQRARDTLAEVRAKESCAFSPERLDGLFEKRILGSNTLELNTDGAQDKWRAVDRMIQEAATQSQPLSGDTFLTLVKNINKGQYGENDNGGMDAAGEMRGLPGDQGACPVSGTNNEASLRCFGKDTSGRDVAVNGKDENMLTYLANEKVPDAMAYLTNWAATQMASNPDNIIVTAAIFMMGLASIHPFHDVNGRTARQSMDFLFMKARILPPTNFNVMLAIFPRLDHCTNASPVAAVNEVIKGLRNTCELAPLAIDSSNVRKCGVSIHCGQEDQPACAPPRPWSPVPQLEYVEDGPQPCEECCAACPRVPVIARSRCPHCEGCASYWPGASFKSTSLRGQSFDKSKATVTLDKVNAILDKELGILGKASEERQQ